MSRRERILAAINRQPVDRVPYAVWRHFPTVDRSPAGLAQATLRFHERYGSDFLKITPRGGYAVEAWGCVEGDEVLPDGHRACATCAVRERGRLEEDPRARSRRGAGLRRADRDDHPPGLRPPHRRRAGRADALLAAVAGPEAVGRPPAPRDLREHPDAGARAPSRPSPRRSSVRRRWRSTEGVSGIFYSIQAASRSANSEEDYARFGEPYDRQFLEAIALELGAHHHPLPRRPRSCSIGWPACPATPGTGTTGRTPPSLARGPRARCRARSSAGSISGRRSATARPSRPSARRATRSPRPAAPGSSSDRAACSPMNTPDANVAAVVQTLGGPLKKIPGVARLAARHFPTLNRKWQISPSRTR